MGKRSIWEKTIFFMSNSIIEVGSKCSYSPESTPMTKGLTNEIGYVCVKNPERTKTILHQDSVKFTEICPRNKAI